MLDFLCIQTRICFGFPNMRLAIAAVLNYFIRILIRTGLMPVRRKRQLDIFLGEYLPIAVFFAVAIVLSAAFVLSAFVFGNQRPDDEKMAAYECGFDAFDDSRRQFDVRFYLVAILFIIFDLEVAFLFPWAVALGGIGLFGFWSMMLFLAVLTVGFIYEWKKGALEWE
jgi:NADH-quinone oxidoreductase subunit A